jgi:hypothetical protein
MQACSPSDGGRTRKAGIVSAARLPSRNSYNTAFVTSPPMKSSRMVDLTPDQKWAVIMMEDSGLHRRGAGSNPEAGRGSDLNYEIVRKAGT